MGNRDHNTGNLNPETHFPWRMGTEPCTCWAFQAPDAPGELVDGYRDWRAGGRKAKLADPSWGKGSHLPQTAPASDPDDPCPTWTTAGKGKSADFFFLTGGTILLGFWSALSPGRLEGGLGTAVSTWTACLSNTPRSEPLNGRAVPRCSIWCHSHSCQGARWHGKEVALWVFLPPPTHTQDPTKI